jgi:hypothetical protein
MPELTVRLHWTESGLESRGNLVDFYGIPPDERGPFLAALERTIKAWGGILFTKPPYMQKADGNAQVEYIYDGTRHQLNVNWEVVRNEKKSTPGKLLYLEVTAVWALTFATMCAP